MYDMVFPAKPESNTTNPTLRKERRPIDLNRKRQFIINALYFALIAAAVYICLRYVLGVIWPFVCAFIFAWLLQGPIRWLTAKRHVRHGLSVTLCLILFFAILGGIIAAVTVSAAGAVQELLGYLPGLYTDTIEPALTEFAQQLEEDSARLSPEAAEYLDSALPEVLSAIGSAVSNLSVSAVTGLSNFAAKLPSRLLAMVMCVIATVFATADFPHISAFLMRQIPARPRHVVRQAKKTAGTVLKNTPRATALSSA